MLTGRLYEVAGRKQWVIVKDGGQLRTWWRAIGKSWQGGEPLKNTSKPMHKIEAEKQLTGYEFVREIQVDPDHGPILNPDDDVAGTAATAPLEAFFYVQGTWTVDQLDGYCRQHGFDVIKNEHALMIGGVTFQSAGTVNTTLLTATVLKNQTSAETLVQVLALSKATGFKVSTDSALVDLSDQRGIRTCLDGWISAGLTPDVIRMAEDADLLPKQIRWSEVVQSSDTGSIFF